MSKPNVLVCGAGIAGPVCAYWLARAGIHATLIERAPELRKGGQQVDIRFAGLQVVQRMGLEEVIRSKTTEEEGIAFVDSNGRRCGAFPVDKNSALSFTSDIEILRGDLAQIFYDVTKESTEYIFGDYVTSITEDGDKVHVAFANGSERDFDLVIGADGMHSKTRKLAFPSGDYLKSFGMYTSFFSIPFKESDGTFAQCYNAPGRRVMIVRPDHDYGTHVNLSIMSSSPADYYKLGVAGQKKMMRELFTDAGWEATRVLEGMDQADDFYMQDIAQVKMEDWSRGRVALVGDAGYCPSPISGMGTSLAIVGAYILAGEIASCGADYQKAFRAYDEKVRPFVDKAQKIPPGAPGLFHPQTKWQVSLLQSIVGFVSWSGLASLLGKLSSPPTEDKSLPLYAL